MGEENSGQLRAVIGTRDGETWEAIPLIVPEHIVLEDFGMHPDDPGPPGDPGVDLSYLPDACNLTIRGSFRQPHMSRKRFIKLMMSRGISRDGSVRVAKFWHSCGLPYSSAWIYMLVFCFSNNY